MHNSSLARGLTRPSSVPIACKRCITGHFKRRCCLVRHSPLITEAGQTISRSPSAMSSAQALVDEATLTQKDGTVIKAKQLWEKQPVFLYCIRRPGCVLCRDEAQKLWQEHKVLEAAGIRVACVVHEWIDREINAFVPEYWAGEIYHDVDKAFYKAFGQGQLRTASALSLLNPFNPAWGRILAARKNVKDSNTSGEASILGGLMVVKPDGSIAWMHAEHTFGEFPETAAVLASVKEAVGRQ